GARPQNRRCLPRPGDCPWRHQRRRAGPAPAISPELLWRLFPRSRRQQALRLLPPAGAGVMESLAIRPFEAGDVPPLLDVYNHYVINTPVTFDIEPRTLAQRQEWFSQFVPAGRHRCFVAARDGRAVGWAASARYHAR